MESIPLAVLIPSLVKRILDPDDTKTDETFTMDQIVLAGAKTPVNVNLGERFVAEMEAIAVVLRTTLEELLLSLLEDALGKHYTTFTGLSTEEETIQ